MHITIIDGDVSYPATSGKRLRTLNLMLQSAQRHRITYIGRCDFREIDTEPVSEFFTEHNIESILVHAPLPRKSGKMFYARLAGNLLSPKPYSVASHGSSTMKRIVREFARHNDVDLWQFEWPPYMATLDGCKDRAPRVVVAHNVDSLIWQRYYETANGMFKRWYLKQQWKKFVSYERKAFQKAHHVIAVSEDDADIIRTKFGMFNVDVVDNGIDRQFFEQSQGTRQENTLLFLGALDWRPNLDAVDLLLEKIFPVVRQQLPDAKLHIVGRHPGDGLSKRITETEGVELHADVPDVRPFLAESSVMAVPLRIGGGSRLKILEALACNCPVVSTSVGAEGLRLEPGRDYILAEPDAMADALVQVLQDPQPAQAMTESGREVVLGEYDWSVLAKIQEEIWEECVNSSSLAKC